jgi:hypothetical protein
MTIIQKIFKAGKLPTEWAKEFPDPEAQVRVEIKEVDSALDASKTLEDVMYLISERAQQRGLNPPPQEILNER